jgi:hypothetical protein
MDSFSSDPIQHTPSPPADEGQQAALRDETTGDENSVVAKTVADETPPPPVTNNGQLRLNRRRRLWRIAIGLFVATFISTTYVHSPLFGVVNHPDRDLAMAEFHNHTWLELIVPGLLYSIPVMIILLAHEFGHFLQCVRYRLPATPPFFIPLPFPPLGTMGAVILQDPRIPNRKVLFDIAVSGPLAGLCVAIPLMFYALSYAKVTATPPGMYTFGDPLIFRWVAEWYHGTIPPGYDVQVDGVGIAVWVGIFVTALNLMPIGQLDGGHILYCLLGKRAHLLALFLAIFAGTYMVINQNFQYALLLALIAAMGIFHPPTLNDHIELGWFRKTVGWLTMLFLIVGFTPNPLNIPPEEEPEPTHEAPTFRPEDPAPGSLKIQYPAVNIPSQTGVQL